MTSRKKKQGAGKVEAQAAPSRVARPAPTGRPSLRVALGVHYKGHRGEGAPPPQTPATSTTTVVGQVDSRYVWEGAVSPKPHTGAPWAKASGPQLSPQPRTRRRSQEGSSGPGCKPGWRGTWQDHGYLNGAPAVHHCPYQ